MGVYGSGPYGHAGNKVGKTATAQCLRLDIRRLKREGILIPGRLVTWSWTMSNGKQSTIGIKTIADDEIRLDYTCTIDDRATPVETRIRLDYSSCNYGNHRHWFRCPACDKRVALLYQKGVYFRCRHCHDLTYYTCQESGNLNDMAIRRVNRVLSRMKSNERCSFDILYYLPERPRYMHRKTYRRLLERYDHKRMEYAASVRVKFESFGSDVREFIELPDGF